MAEATSVTPSAQVDSPDSHYTNDSDVFATPKLTSNHAHQPHPSVDSISMAPGTFRQAMDGPVPINNNPSERLSVYKKLENFKAWGVNTLKCTKQVIEEKLGTAIPTCDETLDLRIEALRHMHRQYRQLLENVRQFALNFDKLVQSQRQLSTHMAMLGQQQPELLEDFARNSETQRINVLQGDKLMCALDAFGNSLTTLVNQTFEDTMLTIRNLHSARVEFDTYRKEVETLKAAPTKPNQNDAAHNRRTDEALTRFQTCESNFLQLKLAVDAKLRLLHENRVRVMQHNLILLHTATTAYFSGDVDKLEKALKQFSIKSGSPSTSKSWLQKSILRSSSLNQSYTEDDKRSPSKPVNGHLSQPNGSNHNSDQ